MNNTITPRFEPAFQGIQRCCKLGAFSQKTLPSVRLVQDAFQQSKLLQNYCQENNVHVIMASNILPNCKKDLSYASLEIIKLFPKPKLNWLGKLVNLFKKKPRESVVIHSYGDNGMMAREKLAEYITTIKSEKDLRAMISHKKYNSVVMEKCKTCGWNRTNIW